MMDNLYKIAGLLKNKSLYSKLTIMQKLLNISDYLHTDERKIFIEYMYRLFYLVKEM